MPFIIQYLDVALTAVFLSAHTVIWLAVHEVSCVKSCLHLPILT